MTNNFDVLKKMSADNKEIMLAKHVVSATTAKGGGHVTMGVPAELLHKIALLDGKYQVVLLVWNIEQFKEVQAELNLAKNDAH